MKKNMLSIIMPGFSGHFFTPGGSYSASVLYQLMSLMNASL